MRVQRKLIAYTNHSYWEDIICPVRILDDKGNIVYEDSYEEKRIIKINKLKVKNGKNNNKRD